MLAITFEQVLALRLSRDMHLAGTPDDKSEKLFISILLSVYLTSGPRCSESPLEYNERSSKTFNYTFKFNILYIASWHSNGYGVHLHSRRCCSRANAAKPCSNGSSIQVSVFVLFH